MTEQVLSTEVNILHCFTLFWQISSWVTPSLAILCVQDFFPSPISLQVALIPAISCLSFRTLTWYSPSRKPFSSISIIFPIMFPSGHISSCYILQIPSKFSPFQVLYDQIASFSSLPDDKLNCEQELHLNKNSWTIYPLILAPRTPGVSLVIV